MACKHGRVDKLYIADIPRYADTELIEILRPGRKRYGCEKVVNRGLGLPLVSLDPHFSGGDNVRLRRQKP